jgi:hypothetical protein
MMKKDTMEEVDLEELLAELEEDEVEEGLYEAEETEEDMKCLMKKKQKKMKPNQSTLKT